jgi:serine/threonine protein kinase
LKGTILAGNKSSYAITSISGEGGVGTVYKARDIASGETVAIKLLHSKRFPLTDVQRQRFHQEIAATTNVTSTYLVAGIDHGMHHDEPFLVMEWMSGGTLQELISSGQYNIDDVVKITCQLLKAFRDLRRLTVVHRDIKPNNVMLSHDRRVKLSDLGIARDLSTQAYLTATEERLGSLLYISERQRFTPQLVTSRDDFYSLCLVLYELISGRRIHTRNIALKYLRPPLTSMALAVLVDRGMDDQDDWESVHDELCTYLNIDAETISREYNGSVLVPESLLKSRVTATINGLKASNLPTPPRTTRAANATFNGIVATMRRSFEECSVEFEASGVRSWMEEETVFTEGTITVHFGADFGNEIELLLEETGLDDLILDGRLFGWIEFEPSNETGFQIAGISGKRLYPDLSYLPDDVFERPINELDDSSRRFLRKVGRGLAIGVAIGALDRIDEIRDESIEEGKIIRGRVSRPPTIASPSGVDA